MVVTKSERRRGTLCKGAHKECITAAPDGGHSWIILVSVTAVAVMAPSIVACFGIILLDVQQVMHTTVSMTALVPTLSQSLNFISTPVAAVVGAKYSFRKVGFIGGILLSTCICLTYFSTSLAALYIIYGVIGGIGFGFSNKAGLFVVNSYFDERRGFATGTYYAGAAACRLTFPIIVHHLLDHYSYPGVLLVWGAILANICVAASLWQPVKWHGKHLPSPTCPYLRLEGPFGDMVRANGNYPEMKSEVLSLKTIGDQNQNESVVILDNMPDENNGTGSEQMTSTTIGADPDESMDETVVFLNRHGAVQDGCQEKKDCVRENKQDGVHRRGWRRTISAVSIASGIISNDDVGQVLKSPLRHTAGEDATEEAEKEGFMCRLIPCVGELDYSLFREPAFYVVCGSSICHSFATVNAYVFLPLLGRSIGLTHQAAFMLSAIGIGEIFGRLCSPWLKDYDILKASYTYMLGAILSTVMAFALPFTNTFGAMLTLSIFLGVGAGCMVGLGSVLCVEAVGVSRLQSAIAFQQFFQGVFTLPSGLILGWLRDVSGDFNQSFYVMGCVYFCAFLIWFVPTIVFDVKKKSEEDAS